ACDGDAAQLAVGAVNGAERILSRRLRVEERNELPGRVRTWAAAVKSHQVVAVRVAIVAPGDEDEVRASVAIDVELVGAVREPDRRPARKRLCSRCGPHVRVVPGAEQQTGRDRGCDADSCHELPKVVRSVYRCSGRDRTNRTREM